MSKPRELVATLLGVRVARTMYGRWRRLAAGDRNRLEPLAEDVRERALDLRGTTDPAAAADELREASERLADALVESAQSDPGVSAEEVSRLRSDLSRELDRIADAEIEASRGTAPAASAETTLPGPSG